MVPIDRWQLWARLLAGIVAILDREDLDLAAVACQMDGLDRDPTSPDHTMQIRAASAAQRG
ncbi:hypothetical protein [Cryobacterium sp. Y82]|uniref:hypothetical protein n=1 Tax=Cryobacterium sp. Y82 TaxID=2045017 RepID=UPI001E5DFA31|nr:hypothetical protein [Cryobacterium sp. Y82]